MDSTSRPWSHIYSSLPRPDSIRLLNLEPAADGHDPLKGSLNVIILERLDIDITHRYTALSYVWGDPTLVGSIVIDGSDDTHERSHHVRIMGDIYQRSATTIIYLGPHTRNVQYLFNHIAARNLERRRLQTKDPPSNPSCMRTSSPEVTVSHHLWLAIHEICANDWFTRAWTFPELDLSVDPRIQCGRILARWPDVAELVESFWQGPARPAPPWRPGVFLNLNKAITQGKGKDTMSNLIRARVGSDVTDPRDFFYCLLGVAKDRQEWESTIRADYNISTPSLYATVAHEMLDHGEIMLGDLLSSHIAANHGPPTLSVSPIRCFLPSWVPDWGIMADHGVDPRETLPQYWEHKDKEPADDLDGVLILPFWQGGSKRITILSGLIPAKSLKESDIEPIARAAVTVLQVPFDLQKKTESKIA
ncbi:heterokaryon incompatibility protein-domain-containing protein [Apiospora saccharicola]|uniref:Heterokaryon incompatibility protein-domain-containing protein n=1 Tax=Apiospora saccharicola TaxID=335842 RepID=A0ABR1W537_9PEZI